VNSATLVVTASLTSTRTLTHTPGPSLTFSVTPTPSNTIPATATPTRTWTSTPSDTIPATPTSTLTLTRTPTDTLVITPTYTHTPVPPTHTPIPQVLVTIVVPGDGDHISNPSQTGFRAKAWDTSVGTWDGAGITTVDFHFTGPTSISDHTENSVKYCAFGGGNGSNPCTQMTHGFFNSLASGDYTMSVRAHGASGDSDWVTVTFHIP
jgi:hypothetical protein